MRTSLFARNYIATRTGTSSGTRAAGDVGPYHTLRDLATFLPWGSG